MMPTSEELEEWGKKETPSAAMDALYDWAGRRPRPFRWNEWQQGYRFVREAMQQAPGIESLGTSNEVVSRTWNDVMTGIHGADWRRLSREGESRDVKGRFVRGTSSQSAVQPSQRLPYELALLDHPGARSGRPKAASEPGGSPDVAGAGGAAEPQGGRITVSDR